MDVPFAKFHPPRGLFSFCFIFSSQDSAEESQSPDLIHTAPTSSHHEYNSDLFSSQAPQNPAKARGLMNSVHLRITAPSDPRDATSLALTNLSELILLQFRATQKSLRACRGSCLLNKIIPRAFERVVRRVNKERAE